MIPRRRLLLTPSHDARCDGTSVFGGVGDTAAAEAPRGFMSSHWEPNRGPEDVNGTPAPRPRPSCPPPLLPLNSLPFSFHKALSSPEGQPRCHKVNQCSRPGPTSPRYSPVEKSRPRTIDIPPPRPLFIILINQDRCTCLSIARVRHFHAKRKSN